MMLENYLWVINIEKFIKNPSIIKHMNYKSLAAWTLLGFLTLGTLGCKSKDTLESKLPTAAFTRTIADYQYQFQGNTVT